jgi:YihY family inner membrane protein
LFFRQRYYTRCSALTYTSLLGFIPLVSVLIAVFSKLPFVKEQLPKIQLFVFRNFLPEQGEKLFDYIEEGSFCHSDYYSAYREEDFAEIGSPLYKVTKKIYL